MNTSNTTNGFGPYRDTIIKLAQRAIRERIEYQADFTPALSEIPESLRLQRACFVTLRQHGNLRGCIGSLEAKQELYLDIIQNAVAAAIKDPRFQPVSIQELDLLHIHVSILSPREKIQADNEQELVDQIRPGVDGLVIYDGWHKATFLPSVWETLPDKQEFLSHLKQKAGLPSDFWSKSMIIERYTAESVE